MQFRFRDGDTIDVLADALDDLRKSLHGVRAMNFTGESRDIILYAANLFGSGKLRKHFSFVLVSLIHRHVCQRVNSIILFHRCSHPIHRLDLIQCDDRDGTKFIAPVKKIHSIVELSYYSNSLAAHFALDAVVMCSLLKMVPKSKDDTNSNSVSPFRHFKSRVGNSKLIPS